MPLKDQMTKTIEYLKTQLFQPGNVVLIAFAAGFIWWDTSRKQENRDLVLDSPVSVKATILGTKGCYKNGKCIDFEYQYKDNTYEEDATITWEFFNWCESRNDCKGMKFKLVLEEGNPENILVYWEEMYQQKKERNKHEGQ